MQPKIKKYKDAELSLDIVLYRLKGIDFYDISLDQDVRDVVVHHLFMPKYYGGKLGNFPKYLKKNSSVIIASSRMDYLMYLNLNTNPHALEVPGALGLYFIIEMSCRTMYSPTVKGFSLGPIARSGNTRWKGLRL
ncbi:hypothetical protein DFS33DRAFT_540345 [Desarmillaria ectypa]|nr:hypothetical protein DFS33DRAFT_540345 [Desarmillaria ectypa]